MTDEHAGSSKDRIGTRRHRYLSGAFTRNLLTMAAVVVFAGTLACIAAARPDKAGETSPASGPTAGSRTASAAAPATKQAAAHGPAMVVAGGTTFDFGKVWPTKENLKHTFKLTNIGDAELKILHVQPG